MPLRLLDDDFRLEASSRNADALGVRGATVARCCVTLSSAIPVVARGAVAMVEVSFGDDCREDVLTLRVRTPHRVRRITEITMIRQDRVKENV